MKTWFPGVVGLLALAFSGHVAAAPLNLIITVDKKRFDVERSATASTNLSKEKWGYGVTVENKSFKNLEGLDVEYRQYKLEDQSKGDGKLKGVPGKSTIPALANGGRFKFETEPVELQKQELKANWSYGDRTTKEKVKDELAGIWIRIFKGGELVAEFQSPPALKQKGVTW